MIKESHRTITRHLAKALDRKALKSFGMSTLLLMENAGRAVAQEAIKNKKRKIAIFCGKGNNGGDGFVAARHLLAYGIKPVVFLSGKAIDVGNEAKANLDILLKLKQKIVEINERNLYLVKEKTAKYELIIDALLGVGLKGDVRGIFKDLIGIINSSKAYILSVDIPSGLDANRGCVLGCCVKASKTVTFVARKQGMVVAEGPKHCGRIIVKDLGIPFFKTL